MNEKGLSLPAHRSVAGSAQVGIHRRMRVNRHINFDFRYFNLLHNPLYVFYTEVHDLFGWCVLLGFMFPLSVFKRAG